jgi:uracil DNA glycosylase
MRIDPSPVTKPMTFFKDFKDLCKRIFARLRRAMSMMRFLKRPRDEDQPSTSATATNDGASKVARPEPPPQSEAVTALLGHLTEPGWLAALRREFGKSYFAELANKIAAERKTKSIFPPEQYAPLEHRAVSFPSQPSFFRSTRDPRRHVFSAFNLTPLDAVRVVILGQDPYHGRGQAHGLAFSVSRGVEVPPSLKNIYTELEQDVKDFRRPAHGNLESWAQRGVMMVNATLTVRQGEANSHQAYGWQTFTDALGRFCSEKMHHDQPQPALRHRNGAPVASQRNQVPRLPVLLSS